MRAHPAPAVVHPVPRTSPPGWRNTRPNVVGVRVLPDGGAGDLHHGSSHAQGQTSDAHRWTPRSAPGPLVSGRLGLTDRRRTERAGTRGGGATGCVARENSNGPTLRLRAFRRQRWMRSPPGCRKGRDVRHPSVHQPHEPQLPLTPADDGARAARPGVTSTPDARARARVRARGPHVELPGGTAPRPHQARGFVAEGRENLT